MIYERSHADTNLDIIDWSRNKREQKKGLITESVYPVELTTDMIELQALVYILASDRPGHCTIEIPLSDYGVNKDIAKYNTKKTRHVSDLQLVFDVLKLNSPELRQLLRPMVDQYAGDLNSPNTLAGPHFRRGIRIFTHANIPFTEAYTNNEKMNLISEHLSQSNFKVSPIQN